MNGGLDAVADRLESDGRRPNSGRTIGTPHVVIVQPTGLAALPKKLRLVALLVKNEIERTLGNATQGRGEVRMRRFRIGFRENSK